MRRRRLPLWPIVVNLVNAGVLGWSLGLSVGLWGLVIAVPLVFAMTVVAGAARIGAER